ncbi:thioesterase superfamily protein [Actinocorallia herbida]|uniref:Acyl-coenzyme A thioesterase THEM4 n=1 Tax=Actinocorallia herbida TaxID=58109 RepID=A0A3N1CUQ8_9ACTN|nr:PaaI family thioesterase [Actinocorallia herbida]ROO85032.1 thioesterase superfamily protein [Actinocorallia herbida]
MTEADHPVLLGRLEESRALAASVRRLIEVATATTAPPGATLAAARGLDAITDALARYVPDPMPPMTQLNFPEEGESDLSARMPFDVMIGRHSPLAPPLTLSSEGTTAILSGTLTRPYEGPPGCVHGGVLATAFDIVCAAANFIAKVPGPTRSLQISYRRPTALHTPCRFEARVDSVDGKNVRTLGRLLQNGVVTCEAVGEFVFFDREAIGRMAARARGES